MTRHAAVAAFVLALAPLVAPAAVPRAGAADDDAFRCALKEVSGVPEADAQTATRLLCEELRRATAGRGSLEISIGTLGRLVLVTAARQDTRVSMTVQVDGLEELPVAAGRIATALAHGQPFASTERVDNLVAAETREPLSKKGSVKFSLGIADVESIGLGARASGLLLGLTYTTPRFALPAEMRFGWNNAQYGEQQLDLFSISVGGRKYLSTRDVSAFVGGGLGYMHLNAQEGSYDSGAGYFDGSRGGIAPYLEGGVEILRTHHGRLALQVRTDFPTGSLHSEAYVYDPYSDPYSYDPYYGPPPSSTPQLVTRTKYVVPVTIGLSVAF